MVFGISMNSGTNFSSMLGLLLLNLSTSLTDEDIFVSIIIYGLKNGAVGQKGFIHVCVETKRKKMIIMKLTWQLTNNINRNGLQTTRIYLK